MDIDEIEARISTVGAAYVLYPFLNGRPTIPWEPNAGTKVLLQLDEVYHFTEPYAVAFLAKFAAETARIRKREREWAGLAWQGKAPADKSIRQPVWDVLYARQERGATGKEIRDATGFGHERVSAVLSNWDRAGVAARPATREP